jgi:hypothetical protein
MKGMNKMTMKIMKLIVFVAAMALSAPAPLHAQTGGKINFGNFSVIPGIELQSIYDDNIYKGNGTEYASAATTKQEKKEKDWINHIKPSLMLNYSLQERGAASMGYRGDFAMYGSNSSNNWKNNQGFLDVNYLAPGGLILGINDLYSRGEDPFGNAEQYAVGRIAKRWTNDVKTKLGYNIMSNLRAMVYYNNSKQKYNDIADYSQDFTENEYGVGVETRFLPKTWGFLRYHYGQRKYDTLGAGQIEAYNSNYKYSRISTGLAWDPGAKFSGEASLGYQMLKYDNEYANAAKTLRRDDKNTWTANTSVNYQATSTLDLSLNISRAVRNSGSDTNEQFTDTGLGLNFNQKFLTKFSIGGGISYSINDYNNNYTDELGALSTDTRSDKNYMANLDLKYDIRDWLGVGIGYNYSRKNSNAKLNEYVDNQFMAKINIVY